MMKLLVFKEYMKKIYGKYTNYIDPSLKFLVAVLAMIVFDVNIGFMPVLKNPAIVIIIGLVCAFVPVSLMLLILMMFVVANIYSLAPELAAMIFIIMIIMYILYFRFTPSDGYVLILAPILFFLKIPYVLPLVIGLVATPISIVAVIFGTFIYFMVQYMGENAATITNMASDSELKKATALLTGVFNNKEMYLILIAFSAVVILVYVIRRMSVDYAWHIAVIVGGILDIFVILIGALVLGIDMALSIWLMIVMSVLSIGIVYVLQLLILSVDYSRTEIVQFEDDDYYYYVKAVPKITVATQEVKVKRINTRKSAKTK